MSALTIRERLDVFGGTLPAREVCALPWLRRELVATPAAVDRLRAWAREGSPDRSADDVPFVGDLSPAPLVIRRLASLPAPVRWFVVCRVLIAAIGRRAVGQAEYLPRLPDGIEHVVTISAAGPDAEVDAVTTHEIAHAWLKPNAPHVVLRPVAARLDTRIADPDVQQALGGPAYIHDRILESELQAASLAAAWGARGRAADPRHVRRLYARESFT